MRARHQLRRAAPMALLASATLISTPAAAAAATDAQPAQPQSVQVQQVAAKAGAGNAAEDRLASAQKALQQAQDQEAAAKKALDAAVQKHEDAKDRAAAARAQAEEAEQAHKQAEADLGAAERRVERFAGSEYRLGGLAGPIIGFLGSGSAPDEVGQASLLNVTGNSQLDLTEKLRDTLAQKRQAEEKAKAELKLATNAERTAATAVTDAEKAHEAALAKSEAVQKKADDPNAKSAPAGGASAPQSAEPGFANPAAGELTSSYGDRWGSSHLGIDVANSTGTPIRAATSGTIISSGPASGFGMWVRVQRDDGLITLYGHINESLVSVGERVEAGEEIAKMGSRGKSTGPHLHFGVVSDGEKIDPQPWLQEHGIGY